jgi:adenine-specific DNA glycosylase
MEFNDTTPFEGPFSVLDNPRLEFVMEVRLTFPEVFTIAPHPNGGMRALPDDGWTARKDGSSEPPLAGEWNDGGAVSHTFTHAQLTLRVAALESASKPPGEGEWWPIDRIDEAGLPTVFAKAASLALQTFSR